jgi:hypothetical protein
VTDRLIRITPALALIAVAVVAAVISYQHAYELVRSHGESGVTARLLPFTVDGLIWAASMVVLDANRRASRYQGWRRGAWARESRSHATRGLGAHVGLHLHCACRSVAWGVHHQIGPSIGVIRALSIPILSN